MRALLAVSAALLAFLASGAAQAPDNNQLTPRQAFDEPRPSRPPVRTTPTRRAPADRPHHEADAPDVQLAPLVLRYSIQRQSEDGPYEDVDPNTTFHSGDHIRVNVQANDSAYLYIAQSGSSGAWRILFPSEESGSDNRIEKYRTYTLPDPGTFAFDDQPGQEKLFVVLSRKQETGIDRLIRGSGKEIPGAGLVAQNRPIDGRTMDRIRSELAPRDLTFEKEPVSETKDHVVTKATYVMDAKRSSDMPVIVDLTLTHR